MRLACSSLPCVEFTYPVSTIPLFTFAFGDTSVGVRLPSGFLVYDTVDFVPSLRVLVVVPFGLSAYQVTLTGAGATGAGTGAGGVATVGAGAGLLGCSLFIS